MLLRWNGHVPRFCTRSFFSNIPLPPLLPHSAPHTYHEARTLPFTRQQLYEVVSDVASYHHFLPYCIRSRVLDTFGGPDDGKVMEAELSVGFLTFEESYISLVTCKPFESVEAVASSSTTLFKSLSTIWRFLPQPGKRQPSTTVTLDLEFAFANPLYAAVSASFFKMVSEQMVVAFERRCEVVYGTEC